jgi:hypothetical protein
MTLLTISTGTPERDAYVAACRLRSCGLRCTPTKAPALRTITLAAVFGDEDRFRALTALGISDGEFLVVDIDGKELYDFTYPHASPGHQFQHQTVSYFSCPEDNLVDGLFLMDLPASEFHRPKKFPQHRSVTWVWEQGIQVITDEVEKGFEVEIAGVLG